MTKTSRILVAVAALALGLTYVLPLWTIDLEAPQYPEGLGMVIHLNTIAGKKPHDLGNINNLNHYIGMKRIEPESIPELRVMPVVVAVLVVAGLVVALLGRRRLLYGWVLLFLGVSAIGLVDFWRWEYDYGHDLDEETAIIKIPGMSYQPPLIGSKRILNFTAHSWPGAGGWVAVGSCLLGLLAAGGEMGRGRRAGAREDAAERVSRGRALRGRSRPVSVRSWARLVVRHVRVRGHAHSRAAPHRYPGELAAVGPSRPPGPFWSRAAPAGGSGPSHHPGPDAGRVAALLTLPALLALAGCGAPGPRPLRVGADRCAECLMAVADDGHGAEVVTRTGRVHTFDSIECMATFLAAADPDERGAAWVTDFAGDGELVPAADAYFLVSSTLTSPMGLGITAFQRLEDRDGAAHAFGGSAATWAEVRERVAEAWPAGRPPAAHGGHATSWSPPGWDGT